MGFVKITMLSIPIIQISGHSGMSMMKPLDLSCHIKVVSMLVEFEGVVAVWDSC